MGWVDVPGLSASTALKGTLQVICSRLDKDLVIFLDEFDGLSEKVLVAALTQLRDGYINRSLAKFPRSINLIGMLNIRDYKAKVRPDSDRLASSSPYNIATKALTLANFTKEEIETLYSQHTCATGQVFENEAVERSWYWSEGQPWLVNALAREAVEEILANEYALPIGGKHIDQAAHNLMRRRDTHIDSLLARLSEPTVSAVIESILAGRNRKALLTDDDVQLCLDLGLVKEIEILPPEISKDDFEISSRSKVDTVILRLANPIYANFINEHYYAKSFRYLPEDCKKWIVGDRIDISQLIKDFRDNWRECADSHFEGLTAAEAIPQLLLYFYLIKVVNSGGKVVREDSLGNGRVDLCLRYKGNKYPIELKIKQHSSEEASLAQIKGYMDICGAKEGWLVVFDRTPVKTATSAKTTTWDKKISWDTRNFPEEGLTVHIVGC
jgi:hypothetical protein